MSIVYNKFFRQAIFHSAVKGGKWPPSDGEPWDGIATSRQLIFLRIFDKKGSRELFSLEKSVIFPEPIVSKIFETRQPHNASAPPQNGGGVYPALSFALVRGIKQNFLL